MTNEERWSKVFKKLGLEFEVWAADMGDDTIGYGFDIYTDENDTMSCYDSDYTAPEFETEGEMYAWLSDNYESVLRDILKDLTGNDKLAGET
jgi:hypothetical protein